ncbi:MAG: 30S ribosomal protein S15 [Bdellovibrionales bacterium]|nr:30S ribosomal protein S15 [Bdellovibrionales bacterium]
MALKTEKGQTIKSFQISAKDTGSSPVQIALLTEKIKELTGHFKAHKKDYHSMRGLMRMVSRRKKLLAYLKEKDFNSYKSVIDRLNLRK